MSRGLVAVRNRNVVSAGAVLLLAALGLVLPSAGRAATVHYLFDAGLSLTGGCSTEKADPVADPWCPGPPKPSAQFENPNITIDSFGDMYVSSHKEESTFTETGGRVDIFSPGGQFIAELPVEGARALAVDPSGNLYVHQFVQAGVKRVTLFRPTVYNPVAGEIAYGEPGEVIIENDNGPPCSPTNAVELVGLAIDPVTEHLFVSPGRGCVAEWSSAAEGPELLDDSIGIGHLTDINRFVAVDAVHERIYVSDVKDFENPVEGVIKVFELGAPHAYLGSLDGSATPNGRFLARFGTDTLDVNEETGAVVVSDFTNTPKAYEFGLGLDADEELLHIYEYFGFKVNQAPLEVAVDNSASSPNHPTVYIPTEGNLPHTFAFRLSEEGEPEVESASVAGVTETEGVFQATINPGGGETTYRIEYANDSSFDGAAVAGEGTVPAGTAGVEVAAPVSGLAPGTVYYFRVVAENGSGKDQFAGRFRTYASAGAVGSCPNEASRIGFSSSLPDCRAYELVSPSNSNGREPRGASEVGPYFPTLQASPDGSRVTFRIEGGTIPGFAGSGAFNGDNYLARREGDGWSTEIAGPSGADAVTPKPGAFSPYQEFSFWRGDTPVNPTNDYVRYPDGHSEHVGRGSLGTDPLAQALLIGDHGSHIIFASSTKSTIRLEPDAPPAGTIAIYDRTGDGVTHVVSLLPGNTTPAPGEDALYVGASLDGRGVAFKVGGILYLRLDDQVTYEIGSGLSYAGISEGGGRIFYMQEGNLFAFDATTKSRIPFSSTRDAVPVNVAADGTAAYFVSSKVLTGKRKNPEGSVAESGKENLYLSREGVLTFVGIVEPADVKEPFITGVADFFGLGTWLEAVQEVVPGIDPSRSTADGSVLVFESRAPLTGYDTAGYSQIYRFDDRAGTLTCMSCNPTGAPPTGKASLETTFLPGGQTSILGLANRVLNLSSSGERAFFQSYDQLNLGDVDGKQDVYEWEAQGVGSCSASGGCVSLISSGQSARDDYLFAAGESGDDAFFLTGDRLVSRDGDPTTSIYDARVGGGFPEGSAAAPCLGEGCRPAPSLPPSLPAPATPPQGKNDNIGLHCPKGKRKVRRHGKARCVKKHGHHRRHRHHGLRRKVGWRDEG